MIILSLPGKNMKSGDVRHLAQICQGQCMNFIFPILNHPLVTFEKFTCYPRQVTMDLNFHICQRVGRI